MGATRDTIPTIRIGLRPDGRLALVLPGLDAHAESAPIADRVLLRVLREVLGSMEVAAARGASPPKIGQRGAPTKEQLREMAKAMEEGGTPHVTRVAHSVKKSISSGPGVSVSQRERLYYCACGFCGRMKGFAEHVQLHWPSFPRVAPPAGYPHREISAQAKGAEQRAREWQESEAGQRASGKVEMDL